MSKSLSCAVNRNENFDRTYYDGGCSYHISRWSCASDGWVSYVGSCCYLLPLDLRLTRQKGGLILRRDLLLIYSFYYCCYYCDLLLTYEIYFSRNLYFASVIDEVTHCSYTYWLIVGVDFHVACPSYTAITVAIVATDTWLNGYWISLDIASSIHLSSTHLVLNLSDGRFFEASSVEAI